MGAKLPVSLATMVPPLLMPIASDPNAPGATPRSRSDPLLQTNACWTNEPGGNMRPLTSPRLLTDSAKTNPGAVIGTMVHFAAACAATAAKLQSAAARKIFAFMIAPRERGSLRHQHERAALAVAGARARDPATVVDGDGREARPAGGGDRRDGLEAGD